MIERKELSKEDITHLAYGLYLQRGCEPGRDIEDWVNAEQMLSRESAAWQAKASTAQVA
jgi:hypothetical protein